MEDIAQLGRIFEAFLDQFANGFDEEYDILGDEVQVDWGFRIFTPPRAWRRRLRLPKAPLRRDDNLYLAQLFREPKTWRRSCRTVRPPATVESLKRSFRRGIRSKRFPLLLEYLAGVRDNQPPAFQDQVDYYRDQVIPMEQWFGMFKEPKSWRRACRAVGLPRKQKPREVQEDRIPSRPETPGTREDVFVYSAPNWRTRLADWWTPPLAGRTDRALLAYLREQAMFMRRVDTLPVFLRAKATRWLDENGVKLEPAVREELVANVVMQAAVVGDKERRAIQVYKDFQRGPSTLKDIAGLTTAVTLTLGLGAYCVRKLSLPEFQMYATLAGQSITHCSRRAMNILSAPQVVAYATSTMPWWRVTL